MRLPFAAFNIVRRLLVNSFQEYWFLSLLLSIQSLMEIPAIVKRHDGESVGGEHGGPGSRNGGASCGKKFCKLFWSPTLASLVGNKTLAIPVFVVWRVVPNILDMLLQPAALFQDIYIRIKFLVLKFPPDLEEYWVGFLTPFLFFIPFFFLQIFLFILLIVFLCRPHWFYLAKR